MNYANMLKHKPDWAETKERFEAWWNRSSIKRPMMRIVAYREKPFDPAAELPPCDDNEKRHIDPVRKDALARSFLKQAFLGESFPHFNINIGPGSLAVYLGSEPEFQPQTVWYNEVIDALDRFGPIDFDPDNHWFQRHLAVTRELRELSGGEYRIGIPDIIEHMDILAAMRGPQRLCMDLMDSPQRVKELLRQIDDVYFQYYDAFHDLVKDEDGASCYTAFHIWGSGRTAKTQCDFSALISPDQFREFVQPSLRRQCSVLDHSLYHLDGPDAVGHLDAILEVDELDALQWTPGAGNAPASDPQWDFIHDKVHAAGKCLWIRVGGGSYTQWRESARRLTQRYGPDGLYLLLPPMTESQGRELLRLAENDW